MAVASPQMLIADLRRWLARMESHGRASATVLPFDIAEVDAHVPGGGLQLGHLHEVIEGGAASEYAGLATLFAAGVHVFSWRSLGACPSYPLFKAQRV